MAIVTAKTPLAQICLLLITVIVAVSSNDNSVLTELYKQAAKENRPLILVVDNHDKRQQNVHQLSKQKSGSPFYYIHSSKTLSNPLNVRNKKESKPISKQKLLKQHLQRLRLTEQSKVKNNKISASPKPTRNRNDRYNARDNENRYKGNQGRNRYRYEDGHRDRFDNRNHNHDSYHHDSYHHDRNHHDRNRDKDDDRHSDRYDEKRYRDDDRYYGRDEDRNHDRHDMISVHDKESVHDSVHDRHSDRYDEKRYRDDDRYYGRDEDRNHDRHDMISVRDKESVHDRNRNRYRYRDDRHKDFKVRGRYRDNRYDDRDRYRDDDRDKENRYKKSKVDNNYGTSVLTNLLRISNDLNCEALSECKYTCKYGRSRSKSECERACEEKYECEDEKLAGRDNDRADSGDCGENGHDSCADSNDADEAMSTKAPTESNEKANDNGKTNDAGKDLEQCSDEGQGGNSANCA